jgi:valyl-tRNA synthetase
VLIQLEKSEFDPEAPPGLLADRWLLAELSQACSEVTAAMEQYQFDRALKILREFSWNVLADNYIELTKGRLYSEGPDRDGACRALRETLDALCRLLAPFAPHFAEEVFSRLGEESVHRKNWPRPSWHDEDALAKGRLLVRLAAEIRRYKHEQGLALNAPMGKVTIFTAGIGDDGGDLSRALNAGIDWRQDTSALERRPGEVTFNMAIIGPALRKDAPAFMAAVRALPAEEVSRWPATVRAGGRDIPVPPGSYELRTEYLVEGEKVDVITVEDVIVTVRKNP